MQSQLTMSFRSNTPASISPLNSLNPPTYVKCSSCNSKVLPKNLEKASYLSSIFMVCSNIDLSLTFCSTTRNSTQILPQVSLPYVMLHEMDGPPKLLVWQLVHLYFTFGTHLVLELHILPAGHLLPIQPLLPVAQSLLTLRPLRLPNLPPLLDLPVFHFPPSPDFLLPSHLPSTLHQRSALSPLSALPSCPRCFFRPCSHSV